MNKKEKLALFNDVDLYPVTCQSLSEGRTNIEVLDGLILGGAKIVQLREIDFRWRKDRPAQGKIDIKKRILSDGESFSQAMRTSRRVADNQRPS